MKRNALSMLVLCSTLALFGALGLAAEEQASEDRVDAWFVELASPPTADGTSLATVQAEKRAFRAAARKAGLNHTERYAFDALWNGLSLNVPHSQVSKLSRIAGVKAVYPVLRLSLPEVTAAENPDLATALAQTGADVAQNALGLSGAGIKVAVMDTGVDYNHPDLGGCFGPGCRVAVGHDFVGDAYNNDSTSPGYNPVPVPDNDPDDCNGHGTHVAGIVGASGAVTGVAPGVTFGAYRVFGCGGSTSTDIMIAAMERALADGMDILNMSIGSSYQWPQYPTAAASDRAVNKGMIVVASIGNSGATGLYSGSAPGVGQKVIGVASFDNTHLRLRYFTITPDDARIGYLPATAAPAAPTSGSSPMARTGTSTSTADACSALAPGSLVGMVALIRRGTCGFHVKALNAQNAGASGVVIYNNVAGIQSITVAGTPAITIPVVSVSDGQGVLINNRLATGPVTMTWTDQFDSFPNVTGNLISSFSSYGLSPDLSLKPDIGAPGGLIRSTWPVELGSYATISGTSMSSPHVAGATALLLEARPDTSSQDVRTILQNSADPKLWWGNPGLGFLDNVHRQGAGMLDIDDAIQSTAAVTPGKLSLGESAGGPSVRTLTVRNDGASDVTYDLSHVAGLATGPNTFTPAFFSAPASVSFSSPTLLVPAGGSASVDVTIAPNAALADKSLYGGWVAFTPQGGGAAYRVPFSGFKGDYQSIVVLTPTVNGFPWLARLTGTSFSNKPAGETYSMADAQNIPYILWHSDHQSRMLRMEVFDAATAKSWHRVVQLDYLGRNSAAATFFSIGWDGQTTAGNKVYTVPDGSYVIKLTVIKALGNAANPADVETWTSPVITIDRP